eukprot:UN0734
MCIDRATAGVKLTVFLMMCLACRENLKTIMKVPATLRVATLAGNHMSVPKLQARVGNFIIVVGALANLASAAIMSMMLWSLMLMDDQLTIPGVVLNGLALNFLTDVDDMLVTEVDRLFCKGVLADAEAMIKKHMLDEYAEMEKAFDEDRLEKDCWSFCMSELQFMAFTGLLSSSTIPLIVFYVYCTIAAPICA